MKAPADALGNMMLTVLYRALDGDISSAAHGRVDMQDFNEAEIALSISRQIALKKKRIVIDIVYPKDPSCDRENGNG